MKSIRERFSGEIVRFAIVVVIVLIVGGVWQAFAAPMAGPEEAPPAALYAIAWNTAAITSDTTSTAYTTQSYAYHDLFCAIDVNATQDITVTYQVSPDNTNWFDSYQSAKYSADISFFTRTLAYGRYSRVNFDISTANQITPVCKSVFSNNWSPAGYVQVANQQ